MVKYNDPNLVDDIFDDASSTPPVVSPETQQTGGGFPRVLPGDFFPDAPKITSPDALQYYAPFLEDESYLKEFATPSLTDEQLDRLYAPSDFKDRRKLALAEFGFGLAAPTMGGQIGPAISQAGQQLARNLAGIKQEQAAEQRQLANARITAELQREAQRIQDKKSLYDANKTLMMEIAGKNYDAQIANNKQLQQLYMDQMKASQAKFQDFQLEGVKPKRVQVRSRDENGELSDPFDAFVVQNILPDGGLSAPQYYRPTNKIGVDGLPMMELIDDPEGIIEVKTTITGTPEDFKSGSGVSTFRDILSGLQTKDRALLTLDKMEQAFREDPSRAGFLAGIQKRFQTYAQIFNDFYNYQFNEFFDRDNEALGIQAGDKFQSLSSTIDVYLQDDNLEDDLKEGRITQEELEGLRLVQQAFDQLGVIGRAEMLNHSKGGKDSFGQELFEGTEGRSGDEERALIYKKLGFFDTELPANEIRANAIIYAIARARKSSGRLNLDDIERAARDLNIYGDSSADVLVKIRELRRELLTSRSDDLSTIKLLYGQGPNNYYERMMADGYGFYDRDRANILVNDVNEAPKGTPGGVDLTTEYDYFIPGAPE